MRSAPALLRLSLSASCLLGWLLVGCSRDSPSASASPGTTTAAAPLGPAETTPQAATGQLAVGKPPPDFTAKSHDGTDLTISALKGNAVVVYFYPRDETPGCTKEACAFRDAWKELGASGVVLIGISTDTVDSHKAFAKHYELPFHLVSDEGGAIARSFGVPNRAGFLGRQTFVIGADGNVKKIYRDVDVSRHAAEILADVKS